MPFHLKLLKILQNTAITVLASASWADPHALTLLLLLPKKWPRSYFTNLISFCITIQLYVPSMSLKNLLRLDCKMLLACHAMQLCKSRASAARAMRPTRTRAARSTDMTTHSYLNYLCSTHLSRLICLRMFARRAVETWARRSMPWRTQARKQESKQVRK